MCPGAHESFIGGRRILGGGSGHPFAAPAAPQAVSVQSAVDAQAQRAHLVRVLTATTTVLFVVSLLYVALSALYCCIREGNRRRRGRRADGGDSGGAAPAACEENTKRALEEIPVHVHVVATLARDGGVTGTEVEEEPDCCAVCLAEYAAGDEVRVLPACRHGFHMECVDRWLLTRAPTCPVCRTLVGPVEEPDAKADCVTGHAGVGDPERRPSL